MKPIFFAIFIFAFILFAGCKSSEQANAPAPNPENKTSATKPSAEATISGIKVKVQSAERVKSLKEGKSNITAGDGQEFFKVTFLLNADSSKNAFEEFNKWRITFVETNDAESGPMFNWTFSDKPKSLAWVYTNPKPVNTKFKSVKIENTVLALPE